jgi:predicted transcriptional regulator
LNKGDASLLIFHFTCSKSGHFALASRFQDTRISIGELATAVSPRIPDGLSERLDQLAKRTGAKKGEAQFYIPVGQAVVDSVLASLGLDRLRAKADAAKLDGLLVLWRAGL